MPTQRARRSRPNVMPLAETTVPKRLFLCGLFLSVLTSLPSFLLSYLELSFKTHTDLSLVALAGFSNRLLYRPFPMMRLLYPCPAPCMLSRKFFSKSFYSHNLPPKFLDLNYIVFLYPSQRFFFCFYLIFKLKV
jgi:hypothetical protein